jgi:GIY-YIG catalytic domain
MDIELVWRTPVNLNATPKGAREDYLIPEHAESRIPKKAGVYIFCRKFGRNYEPLYVGQADNLRMRIKQHLKSNVALMRALRDAKSGTEGFSSFETTRRA